MQIAKSFGADVTGVCSTRIRIWSEHSARITSSITRKRISCKGAERYDVILDNVPNHSLSECRHVLNTQREICHYRWRWTKRQPLDSDLSVVSYQNASVIFVRRSGDGQDHGDSNQKDLTVLAT